MVGTNQGEAMTAREEILQRIRDANTGVQPPAVSRGYRRNPALEIGVDALLDLFEERLSDYRATVTRCRTGAIGATVSSLLGDTAPVVRASGLPEEWCPTAVPDDPSQPARDLDRYAAAVTAAAAACAETGTIALDSSADQGRRALTLIPDLHVCIVRSDQVVHSVPQMLALLPPQQPITFISGPSATSDIELERVEGVHGPRTLSVVLVETD
jgi:L-lactate dehydrogenase complex protein LldG